MMKYETKLTANNAFFNEMKHPILQKFTLSIIIVFGLAIGCCKTWAQETLRPVSTTWALSVGTSHLTDTYLSPLKYSGWSTAISYNRMQVLPWANADSWISSLAIGADLDRALNPAGNATMWGIMFHASWGTMKRWKLPYDISVAIGPAVNIEGGCLYNGRNGNNPASAKAAVTLDAIGFIAWNANIGKLPFTISYQPSMPVVGAFFSPRYDELYYEIYLGNHSNLAHAAWWGTRFKLDNLVALDLHLGSSSLRIGYDCSWMCSKVNNLTTRMITHRLLLGVTCDWLSARKFSGHNNINPALY